MTSHQHLSCICGSTAQTPLGLCSECGEEIEDFMSEESEICFACHEFFQERESRAIGWAEAMEANYERTH
jgi:hypothetical protein